MPRLPTERPNPSRWQSIRLGGGVEITFTAREDGIAWVDYEVVYVTELERFVRGADQGMTDGASVSVADPLTDAVRMMAERAGGRLWAEVHATAVRENGRTVSLGLQVVQLLGEPLPTHFVERPDEDYDVIRTSGGGGTSATIPEGSDAVPESEEDAVPESEEVSDVVR